MTDLGGLLTRLIAYDVEFVVVGGFAAVAHGSPLMTMDIDVCCDMADKNIRRLLAALADLNPVHRMTPKHRPFTLESLGGSPVRNLYLDTDWGQLDCLGEVLGLGDFNAVLKESETVDLSGHPCRILTVDALIEAKRAMGRPRDLETIAYLQAIRAKDYGKD